MRLKGKVAIVTGAAQGLGLAIAKRYLVEGARVVVADIKDSHNAANQLNAGDSVVAIPVDVADEASVGSMLEAALRQFGRVDILVNNAALASALTPGPFENISVASWRRVMDVNVMGAFLCSRAVVAQMRLQKGGRILNFTSGTVFIGSPYHLHYVSSKGAILAMTRALAKELGKDNILVNAISPGFTLTEGFVNHPGFSDDLKNEIVRARALARPEYAEDLVGTAVFLVSDDASFMTGQTLYVDGGAICH
jgi:NAD(P)-dependent dehydrogenase (short-subunit alcohol dehydrogenase family)